MSNQSGGRRVTLVAVIVLTVASFGLLAWQRLTSSAAPPGNSATLSGLTVEVGAANWVEMGHAMPLPGQPGFDQPGYQMPAQMMPGAPQGNEVRLGISITLSNTDSGTRQFSLVDEFALVGGLMARPVSLKADTIGTLPRLSPGAAVHGTLYFDLEVPTQEDPPLYLQWTREGETAKVAITLDATRPSHGHG